MVVPAIIDFDRPVDLIGDRIRAAALDHHGITDFEHIRYDVSMPYEGTMDEAFIVVSNERRAPQVPMLRSLVDVKFEEGGASIQYSDFYWTDEQCDQKVPVGLIGVPQLESAGTYYTLDGQYRKVRALTVVLNSELQRCNIRATTMYRWETLFDGDLREKSRPGYNGPRNRADVAFAIALAPAFGLRTRRSTPAVIA